MTATKITLTKLEREILDHRLQVDDALGDCLEEDGYSREDVSDACTRLLESKDIPGDYDRLLAECGTVVEAVMQDAVEGSTYYGASKHQVSPQMEARILKAGESLAEKIAKIIGKPVSYPNY